MLNFSQYGDKTAIGLSMLCAAHCFAAPILLSLGPMYSGISLVDESFHLWLLIAVIPCSLASLWLGCRSHKNYHIPLIALFGILLLMLPVLLGHDRISELQEKTLSVIGSLFIAGAHWRNYQLCQCDCQPDQ